MRLIVERPPIANRAVSDGWVTKRLPMAEHAVAALASAASGDRPLGCVDDGVLGGVPA